MRTRIYGILRALVVFSPKLSAPVDDPKAQCSMLSGCRLNKLKELRCFPLEPFFEINPGILCSGIGS